MISFKLNNLDWSCGDLLEDFLHFVVVWDHKLERFRHGGHGGCGRPDQRGQGGQGGTP